MKKRACLGLVLLLLMTIAGCKTSGPALPYILPVTMVRNNVNITIDPRVELMSIVQYLSDYDELITTAEFKYRSDVDEYFADFQEHRTIKMYEDMVLTGFKYSSPANFALSLTGDLRLDDDVQLGNHVLWGGGGRAKLKEFAAALREFSLESNFHEFYVDNEDYYHRNAYRVATLVGDWDYVSELQDYYGMEYNSFNIIPVPLYGGGGGFGPHVERDGQIDIFSILCSFDSEMRGEIPIYGNDFVFKLLQRHEFSHSFVNRITEMHMEEAMKYDYLLDPIRSEMEAMAYGTWITCLNEHVVRSVTTRLAFSDSPRQGSEALARELEANFIYTDVLVQALIEYENNRDVFPDFISFYPRLLEALGGN